MPALRPSLRPSLRAVAVLLVAVAALVSGAAAQSNAAVEYERLAGLLAEIEDGPDALLDHAEGDSLEAYLEGGAADARVDAWLARTRPIAPDILRATDMPYARPLDLSAGFELTLPHLSQQRSVFRALRVLMADARRSDPAMFVKLLRAQSTLGARCAEDGLLVSSLVAMSAGTMARDDLAGMVDRGEIDAEFARGALDASAAIAGRGALRIDQAFATERAALEGEVAKLGALDKEARQSRLVALGVLIGDDEAPAYLDDDAIAGFPAQSEAFFAMARRAADAPNAEECRKAMRALDESLAAGEFGDLLRDLAPALGRVLDRAWKYDESWSLLRADLVALASGAKQPADFMNAAAHYMRAAAAAEQIGRGEQDEIDAVRRAGGALPEELRAQVRALLVRLEPHVTAELLAGSRCGRLRFSETLLDRHGDAVGSLVDATQPGISGAVRVALAAARQPELLPSGINPKPVASAQEIAVAAMRVAAHYGSTARIGHAVAARHMLRDAAELLEELDRDGRIDAQGRAALADALARLDPADPTGVHRALVRARTGLAAKPLVSEIREGESPFSGSLVLLGDSETVGRLTPRETLFLATAVVLPPRAVHAADCGSPEQGALLDMRGWFDQSAIASTLPSNAQLRRRARLEVERREMERGGAQATDRADKIPVLAGTPLQGLDVKPAFDHERLASEAAAEIARLRVVAERR